MCINILPQNNGINCKYSTIHHKLLNGVIVWLESLDCDRMWIVQYIDDAIIVKVNRIKDININIAIIVDFANFVDECRDLI